MGWLNRYFAGKIGPQASQPFRSRPRDLLNGFVGCAGGNPAKTDQRLPRLTGKADPVIFLAIVGDQCYCEHGFVLSSMCSQPISAHLSAEAC